MTKKEKSNCCCENGEDYNRDRMNDVAEVSMKYLMTLNSGAIIALLSSWSKVSENLTGALKPFAIGLTAVLIFMLFYYLTFKFGAKCCCLKNIGYSIAFSSAVFSGVSFLYGVWSLALIF